MTIVAILMILIAIPLAMIDERLQKRARQEQQIRRKLNDRKRRRR